MESSLDLMVELSLDKTVEQNMEKGPDQQKESQEQEDEEEDDEDESDKEDVLSGNCLGIPSLTFLWVAKHAEILYKSLCMAVAAMHDS